MSFGFNSSKSSAKDLTPDVFANKRFGIAQELDDRIGGDVRGLEGPFVAPVSQNETDGLNAIFQNSFGSNGVGPAQDNFISSTLGEGPNSPFLSGAIDAAISPILSQAVDRALQDRSAFTLAGQKIQGSSAFAEDQLKDRQETDRTIANVAAQLAFQDSQQQSQRQFQAAELASARLSDQREAVSALALPRLVEQFGIDKANEEFTRRLQVIENSLQLLASLSSPTPVTESSSFGLDVGGLDKLGGLG